MIFPNVLFLINTVKYRPDDLHPFITKNRLNSELQNYHA